VISWRLAFLINVPIGIVIIVIAVLRDGETHHERLKLDVTGALARDARLCFRGAGVHAGTATRMDRSMGDRRGVASAWFLISFLLVERAAATHWCRSRVDNRTG